MSRFVKLAVICSTGLQTGGGGHQLRRAASVRQRGRQHAPISTNICEVSCDIGAEIDAAINAKLHHCLVTTVLHEPVVGFQRAHAVPEQDVDPITSQLAQTLFSRSDKIRGCADVAGPRREPCKEAPYETNSRRARIRPPAGCIPDPLAVSSTSPEKRLLLSTRINRLLYDSPDINCFFKGNF